MQYLSSVQERKLHTDTHTHTCMNWKKCLKNQLFLRYSYLFFVSNNESNMGGTFLKVYRGKKYCKQLFALTYSYGLV